MNYSNSPIECFKSRAYFIKASILIQIRIMFQSKISDSNFAKRNPYSAREAPRTH